jgi:hypothetical protein
LLSADEAPAEASSEGAEEKPKRRTTRSRKADEAPAEASTEGAEEKPKRRTTRSRTTGPGRGSTASEPEGVGPDGEPQGIWGRFRSARKPRGAAGS